MTLVMHMANRSRVSFGRPTEMIRFLFDWVRAGSSFSTQAVRVDVVTLAKFGDGVVAFERFARPTHSMIRDV